MELPTNFKVSGKWTKKMLMKLQRKKFKVTAYFIGQSRISKVTAYFTIGQNKS